MEAPSKEKVLITGITGFTGVHLEKSLLEKGYLVYGTSLSPSTSINHFKCDILEEKMLFDVIKDITPDYIVHLAAISFVAEADKKSIYNVNIFGTLNVLSALERLKHRPKKIIIASSAAVYGDIEGELHEEMCPKPVNHYGNSKLVMENMVKHYFDSFNIIIVRPFNYTGIGQESHFLIPKIITHFQEQRAFIELGNLNTFREYNDVNYVTEIYLKLLKSSFKSGAVNVCSGKTYSISEILAIMQKLSNHSIEVRINSAFVRKHEIKELKGSMAYLTKILEHKPELRPIKDTLREIYQG